jgi:hypothetical protein
VNRRVRNVFRYQTDLFSIEPPYKITRHNPVKKYTRLLASFPGGNEIDSPPTSIAKLPSVRETLPIGQGIKITTFLVLSSNWILIRLKLKHPVKDKPTSIFDHEFRVRSYEGGTCCVWVRQQDPRKTNSQGSCKI